MDDNFRDEYGKIVNQALLAVNAYYFSHIEELSDAFRDSLEAACGQVRQMQAQLARISRAYPASIWRLPCCAPD